MLSIIACVMAVYNLFYNNLLLNLRFRLKIKFNTISKVIYDWPNICFCHLCCHALCRDRWGSSLLTPLKWLVKCIYLIIVISLIKVWKNKHGQLTLDVNKDDVEIKFDDLLIVYLF